MKPAREWRDTLGALSSDAQIEVSPGREGELTLRVRGQWLHSRYRPKEEAARLIDSAGLDMKRPVLVVGSGLGYHVLELMERGADVAVIEPDPAVAKAAVEHLLRDRDVLLGFGDLDPIEADSAFQRFVTRIPQVFVHPPTARLHPEYANAAASRIARAALEPLRLRIAVVGPMYGGSLPIAGYLDRAFRTLGHQTLYVDNGAAWPVCKAVMDGVKNKQASEQLTSLLARFLGEWSYARVAEFLPDICVVMAQAPVGASFPARLAKENVVTAFWYVENWRHLPYWREIAPLYDVFFHIQPGEFERLLDQAGCPCHAYVQTACDPEAHHPIALADDERAEFGCDLSFAGAGYYNRVELFKGLTDYDFRIWGVDWTARELQPLLRHPDQRFTSEQFAKIVAGSKINLNLHSSTVLDGVDPQADAINPRVFEIAACGGFQLCDPCAGLDTLFDFDCELPVYRNLKELRAKIDYFLGHEEERKAIADRARTRVLRDHTYEHRARRMLDVIVDRCGMRILRKGVRFQRTVGEMAERVGRDTSLGRYLGTLPSDLPFLHESVNEHLPRGKRWGGMGNAAWPAASGTKGTDLSDAALPMAPDAMSDPEKIFNYLREVRSFAESLLERRF